MSVLHAARHPREWLTTAGPTLFRTTLNPVMLQLAGRRYWYAGTIEHAGRRSGKRYFTPVAPHRVPGGFAVPLPYGPDRDWVRNLEAAGHAVLVFHGVRHPVSRPRVVTFAEIAAGLDLATRVLLPRMIGDAPWLLLSTTEPTAEPIAEPTTEPAAGGD